VPAALRRLREPLGLRPSRWGFALYRASHDDYQDTYLPTGDTAGTPEDALDCACGLYLNHAPTWQPDTTP
jgi:hypothetical protein